MKKIKTFTFSLLVIGLLIISNYTFHSCKPEEVDVENNGEMCDTCVIVYNPDIPSIKSTTVKQN